MTISIHFKSFSGIILAIAFISTIHAQENHSLNPVNLNIKNTSLDQVFTLLEKQTSFRFAYNSELIEGIKIGNFRVNNMPLRDCLSLLFKDLPVDFVIIGNQIIIRSKPAPKVVLPLNYPPAIRDSFIIMPVKPLAGLIQSEIPDKLPNIPIPISITTIPGISKNKTFSTSPDSTILLNADKSNDLLRNWYNQPPVLAAIDLTPGLLNKGETEQHTVVMDEMPLYNTGQFFGLTGTVDQFIPEKPEWLSVILPASMGGYPGPVLKATMKEGNFHDPGFLVRLGNIDAGIQIHSPLVSEKASVLITAQRSTFDLLLKPAIHGNYFKDFSSYGFSAKVSFRPSERNLFSAAFFKGRNENTYSADSAQNGSIYFDNNYDNTAVSLNWNHRQNSRLSATTFLSYNQYNQTISASQERYYAVLHSGIIQSDVGLNVVYEHNTTNIISAGVRYEFTSLGSAFVYDKLNSNESSFTIDPSGVKGISGNQISLYLADDLKFTSAIHGYLGLRLPVYIANKVLLQPEPRISLSFLISSSTAIRFSYNRNHQYFSRVNSSNASFPADIWITANKEIKPRISDNVAMEIRKQFQEGLYTGLTVYYRYTGNYTLFYGEKTPAANDNIEKFLVSGKGNDYGSEIYIGKSNGRLTGIVSYGFSYAMLSFPKLNDGRDFPPLTNRPHLFKSLFAYRINPNLNFITRFVAASGEHITLREDEAEGNSESPLFDNPTGNDKEDQSNHRLSPYHRLDVGICYSKSFQITQRELDTHFELMLNNVYARKNTILSYRSINSLTNLMEANEVSLFPFLPCLTVYITF